MKQNRYLLIGVTLSIGLLLFTFIGPHLPFVDKELSGERILFPEGGGILMAPFSPSDEFPLGTDRQGLDILSLIMLGAQETLSLVLLIVLIRYVIAIPFGFLAAKGRGFFYWLLNGWNQLFSSFPIVITSILLLCLPPIMYSENRYLLVAVVLALIEMGRTGMAIQKQAYYISQSTYFEAGVTMGTSPLDLMRHYYIPNMIPDLVVQFFSDSSRVIVLVGQLAIFNVFITHSITFMGNEGFLVENTNHNWGSILSGSRNDILFAPWIPIFPMIAIVLLIISFNILGEGLRRFFNRRVQSY